MNVKIYDLCMKVVKYLVLIALCALAFLSVISTTYVNEFDQVYYIGDRAYIHALFIIALLALLCVIYSRTKFRITDGLLLGTLITMTALTAIYISLTNLQPRLDQQHIRAVAGNLMYGITDDYLPGGYAEIYPYQNGLILLYKWILEMAGYDRYIVIQYFNLACMVLTEVALYLIFKRLSGHYREMSMGMLIFMPFWLYADFLYGIIPGLLMGAWGVYFAIRFLDNVTWYDAVLTGLAISLSCMMKLNYIILLIAVALVVIMSVMRQGRPIRLMLIVVMVILYLAGDVVVDHAVRIRTGYSPSEGIPGIASVAMGLHEHTERGAGWHDNYPENTYESSGYDSNAVKGLARADIKDSMRNFAEHPAYTVGFFIRKTTSLWSEPTYYSWAAQQGRDKELDHKIFFTGIPYVTGIMNLMQTVLYLFALVWAVRHIKEDDVMKFLPGIYFLGGFLCHVFWEAHSQYALPYAMMLIPYSTAGMIETVKDLCGMSRRGIRKAITIFAITGLLLSILPVSSVLTLDRDGARYAEYVRAPY